MFPATPGLPETSHSFFLPSTYKLIVKHSNDIHDTYLTETTAVEQRSLKKNFCRPSLTKSFYLFTLSVGAAIGKGSYFAVNPNYSAQGYASPDAKGHKRMYQAKVLVGEYTQGNSGMITPPAKSGSASDLYDSVTDNMSNPTMFVVFNDIQAYPEYLITFT